MVFGPRARWALSPPRRRDSVAAGVLAVPVHLQLIAVELATAGPIRARPYRRRELPNSAGSDSLF